MKNLLFFLAIICCSAANAQHTSHWKAAGGAGYGYYQGGNGTWNPGDTIYFLPGATRTYFTLADVHGTAQNQIVLWAVGKIDMINGFSLTKCSDVKIDADTTVSQYGFTIHDDVNKTGVGITITGLSRRITVRHTDIYNKLYGFWVKYESNQTGCDSTQWYPHYEDSIIIDRNKGHKINQEYIYAGSTDPGGLATERAVDCYGMHFTPRSAALKNIFIRFNIVEGTGRSGIQLSAESFGRYEIIGNIVTNSGFETSLTQWPNIWIGGEGQAYGEIAYNTLDSASRNNITIYGNNVNVHDNNGKNAGIARDVNTNAIYRFSYYPPVTISIRSTHPYTKTCFKIKNNSFTPTGANTAIYLEGNATDYTDTGNYICNSGTIGYQDANIKFYNGCSGGDTSTTVYKVKCDTPRVGKFHVLVKYDSIVPLKDVYVPRTYDKGNRTYDVHTKQDKIFHNTKDSTYDSTFICPKCGSCDSIAYNININKLYGLMPFSIANAYGIANTRDIINVRFFKPQKQNIKRVRAYDADHITINLSTRNEDVKVPANYPTDTVAYKVMVHDAHDSFPNIKKYVIENEEGNVNYFADGQDISLYCNMFAAALHQLNSQGITDVTNGGLIWIRFWYYGKTHDADFFNNCFNSIQRSAWNNGTLAYKTQQVTYEIDFLKSLPTLKKINIHQLYISDTAEFAGLKRMIDYLKTYTGKQVTSNEVGYYVDDVNLLIGLNTLALQENFEDLIFYSGDGSDKALAIPQDQIKLIL